MAYKLRHKETGLFFCRAKGLADDKRYGELGSRENFLNRHLSKRGRVYEHISEKQKNCISKTMQMNLKYLKYKNTRK